MLYYSILICLFIIGVLSQFYSGIPKDTYKRINKFIMYAPLPAITLYKIPQLELNGTILLPILSAWIIFLFAILFFIIIGKILHLSKQTIACLILCCGLGNTSFVGFPFLTYLYGKDSIQYAIFVDQPGSFFIMASLGIFIATTANGKQVSILSSLKKIASFPPFICFIIALVLPSNFFATTINNILYTIGNLMIPLALLSLGMQFKIDFKTIPWQNFLLGIFYKLLLAPFVIYILYFLLLRQGTYINKIALIECAMPPMITSSIIAADNNLDEDLAGVLPTLGILFSIPTLLFWKAVLH